MQANTSRKNRFEFNKIADLYARGRPFFDRTFVIELLKLIAQYASFLASLASTVEHFELIKSRLLTQTIEHATKFQIDNHIAATIARR